MVWFHGKRIFEDGCPALQDLASQAIQLNTGGFNITSNKGQGQVDDNFWSDEDEDE
jgi:hypothetical protein